MRRHHYKGKYLEWFETLWIHTTSRSGTNQTSGISAYLPPVIYHTTQRAVVDWEPEHVDEIGCATALNSWPVTFAPHCLGLYLLDDVTDRVITFAVWHGMYHL